MIYNSVQGLESMYCFDPDCNSRFTQILKCDAKLYSSALLAIDPPNIKCKNADGAFCHYYIVVGHGSLSTKSTISTVSLFICYDIKCTRDLADEVIIDTNFDSSSYPFGYSISLTSWTDLDGESRDTYPLFTYSKYSDKLKQFVLKIIICLDPYCSTWIGKSQSTFASNPPYVALGTFSNLCSLSIDIQFSALSIFREFRFTLSPTL